uniref:Uncharacterized protein n=1 Tax=Mus spicilegus TaxID=10103 RepID=A0A8C6GGW6_MUSSI
LLRTGNKGLGQHSTAPFLPPRPSHLSQITFFCRASFLVAPLYKSSKNISKISMGEPKPPPAPPSLIACSPPLSYSSLFLESARTS